MWWPVPCVAFAILSNQIVINRSHILTRINKATASPFPLSEDIKYCSTVIDRFTRWPDAIPIPNITAPVVVKTLAQWLNNLKSFWPTSRNDDYSREVIELMENISTQHLVLAKKIAELKMLWNTINLASLNAILFLHCSYVCGSV